MSSPTAPPARAPASTGRVLASLWRAVWIWRWRTLAAMSLLIAAKLSAVGVPMLLKAVVDQLSVEAPLPGSPASLIADPAPLMVVPVFLLLAYALLRFAGTVFTELRDLVFARVTQRTVMGFAERSFAHLLALSPRFHVERNTGALIRDVERGTGGIGFLLGAGVFTLLPTLVEFGAVLAIIAWGYNLWFGAIIGLTFFAYATFTTLMTQQRVQRQRKVNELDTQASGHLVDTLLNYESVKTHAREAFEGERYAAVLAQWVDKSVGNQRALSLLHVGQSAIIAAGVAAVMLLAGAEAVRGQMTVGDVVLVNAYLIQICLPLNALGFVFREARDALVDTEKLFELYDQQPDIVDTPDSQPLREPGGVIRFEQVDFGYEPGRQILRELSLEIGAGRTMAIVGGSGSGKSTLARLLLRLYDVDRGRISIGAQDLRRISLASLREAVGVVPQDTVLFNDTIAYNIGYGRSGATMEQIVAAAQAAQADDFIRALPEQYDTVVGERGVKLSGGEKQRVAIARAFLKNPPIMVFDEATSALDTRAERAIQGALERIARNRSSLIIAHRLSTIVNADEIIVMDRGRIAERGRHAELLARHGLYAQLWDLQRQQQQAERLERHLNLHPVNIAALLIGMLDGLRGSLAARDITLYTQIDPDSPPVSGEAGTLSRIVQLLCQRCAEDAPAHGRIEARLGRQQLSSRLVLGYGGAPGEAPAVPDTLELRTLVEGAGGRLIVESHLPQGGLRYGVELPLPALAPEPAAAELARGEDTSSPQEPTDAPNQAPLDGLRLLCVDDDEDALDSLAELLRAYGAEVRGFASGHEALDWLGARPVADWPALLVCDIALGPEDGHAVVRHIRAIEAQRQVPLQQRLPAIALTGLAQPDDRVRAMAAGFQLHMAKPVRPDELLRALTGLAGRRPR